MTTPERISEAVKNGWRPRPL